MPTELYEAQCLCERCIDPNNQTEVPPNTNLRSSPIQTDIIVKRSKNARKLAKFPYQEERISVSFGCRCDFIL